MKKEFPRIKLDPKYQSQLLARGMNRLALTVPPFRLRPSDFTVQVVGRKPKHIDEDMQLGWFEAIVEEPFKPWCFCITSDPNDRLAKLVAAYIMQQAVMQRQDRLPLWHDVMSTFDNPMVHDETSRPSLLVISNVLPNSTATKFEKLRDILEYHSRIPRIIVSSGEDPFTFFNKHLYYPLNGCVYLSGGAIKADVEI